MIAVGSDRGCPSGTIYIVGSSPTCLGLFLLKICSIIAIFAERPRQMIA